MLSPQGVAQFYRDRKKHVITTQTEHKCVLDSCRWLQQRGWDVTYLPVQKDGLLDLQVGRVPPVVNKMYLNTIICCTVSDIV